MLRMMITSRQAAGGEAALLQAVRRAANAGVDFIQVREKDLPARGLFSLSRRILAASGSARVLINTRADVALAAGAHGVHLPGGAPPPTIWNPVAPAGFLFSVACHSVEAAVRAEREDAGLIVFAPVFDPRSKPAAGPAAGLETLAAVCAAVRTPVLALGGITEERIAPCIQAGAAGFASISYFLETRTD